MLALVRESPEEWQHASALYAQLIEAFPSNPCLLSAGGVANLRSGQLEQGMEKIALAAQLDKEDVDIGLLHALVLLETDVEGATALLQRHRERNPKHVGVNYLLAMILLNGQQIEQAIPYLERADDGGLDLDAMLLEAYFLVGKMETYLPLASEMGLPLGDGGAIASAQDPWTAYFSRIGILPTQGLTAVIRTNMGEMRCRLYVREAPVAVANFVGLSDGSQPWTHPTTGARQTTPLYPGTVFHRVIPGFMIQGGDPLGTGSGGPGYEFPDEVHKRSEFDHPGVLALANKGPGGSNGSQWFITEAATPHLNGLHTILGECDEASVEVVRQIARVPRDKSDRPTDPVVLEQISFAANDSPL